MVTRVNVDGYTYSYDSNTEKLVLTEYTDTVANISTPVIESVDFYRLTIIPTPADATVTLTATGYSTVSGTGTQYIYVESGTTVHYEVSKKVKKNGGKPFELSVNESRLSSFSEDN